MPNTSVLGAALPVEGVIFQIDNGLSPDTFVTVANVSEISLPTIQEVVDVTNVGDVWRRRIGTLKDMGKIALKIFWQPEDPTHNNSSPYGLRYVMISGALRNFQILYPNGTPGSVDAFPAYVTGFSITGMVGKVFEASVDLSNNGAPSLA